MQRKTMVMLLALVLAVAIIIPSWAQSTSKSLSTNFTLINFGTDEATVAVQYLKDDGTNWTTSSDRQNFTIDANGGQAILRQYDDPNMTDGRGSVVVSSSQPLGAVVQIQARNQTPTSGAYSGLSQGASTFYVPLAMRRLSSASGTGNSQIIVQNTGTGNVNVEIDLIKSDGTLTYTKTGISVPEGASYYYDLDEETNLSVGWYGSAVVRATTPGGEIAVVSNLFSGSHGMQTFNAFASPDTIWLVPLFTSRLNNGLSTPIAVQNLSGASIPANGVQVTCTKDAASPGPSTLNMSNAAAIGNSASYFFNPVTDTSIPGGWFGSCRIQASGNVVAFVQMRTIGTDEAAAYEAIPAGGTDRTVFVPLVAKRLGNGFATAVTIQNLSTTNAAHVNLTYVPSSDYVTSGGSSSNMVIPNVEIPASGSLIHNHRTTSGVPQLPEGWFGTLVVESSDQPIHAFVQLTRIGTASGDTFMAHNAFTQ